MALTITTSDRYYATNRKCPDLGGKLKVCVVDRGGGLDLAREKIECWIAGWENDMARAQKIAARLNEEAKGE